MELWAKWVNSSRWNTNVATTDHYRAIWWYDDWYRNPVTLKFATSKRSLQNLLKCDSPIIHSKHINGLVTVYTFPLIPVL